jgi:hypothetical protein
MRIEKPEPDHHTPSAAENVYFELVGARIHTSSLTDELKGAEALSTAEAAQILDQCARLLGDLSLLASAEPLRAAPEVTYRTADLVGTLRTAAGTFRDVVDRLPHDASAQSSPMSVDEIADARDAMSRDHARALHEDAVKLTVELTPDEVRELGVAASNVGVGVVAFMKQAAMEAAQVQRGVRSGPTTGPGDDPPRAG